MRVLLLHCKPYAAVLSQVHKRQPVKEEKGPSSTSDEDRNRSHHLDRQSPLRQSSGKTLRSWNEGRDHPILGHTVHGLRQTRNAGLDPGPQFQQILEQVRDAQLNLEISDFSEAIQMAVNYARDAPPEAVS